MGVPDVNDATGTPTPAAPAATAKAVTKTPKAILKLPSATVPSTTVPSETPSRTMKDISAMIENNPNKTTNKNKKQPLTPKMPLDLQKLLGEMNKKLDGITNNITQMKTNTDKLGVIGSNVETIKDDTGSIKSTVEQIQKNTDVEESVVRGLMVDGIPAQLAIDYIDEVTVEQENASVLVLSDLGKEFRDWMKKKNPNVVVEHREIFDRTWRVAGQLLLKMLDSLQMAGLFPDYKRNWQARSNIVLDRKMKSGRDHRAAFRSERGRAVSCGRGRGRGRCKRKSTVSTSGAGADAEGVDQVQPTEPTARELRATVRNQTGTGKARCSGRGRGHGRGEGRGNGRNKGKGKSPAVVIKSEVVEEGGSSSGAADEMDVDQDGGEQPVDVQEDDNQQNKDDNQQDESDQDDEEGEGDDNDEEEGEGDDNDDPPGLEDAS
ncbi:hypothetical protein HK097_005699 [Rhizophlyctis rosea]|uniref:Uncharacterized protein n=1 Tax=Rhizophlyctis rosea TaxID=64517 RepID=A0AAD5S0D9_9FUNG|nr:hypothetical protein HK097_005699 [Rhizophlyctis rosea]